MTSEPLPPMRGTQVDYDRIAPSYDERYAEHDYGGIEAALRQLVRGEDRVLEVGCGTGHWLERLNKWGCWAVGVDPSAKMLTEAQARLPTIPLIRAYAERLPFQSQSLDAVVAINALHHFSAPPRFAEEAMRVLKPGGRVATIGLDPSRGLDRWYVYEYFDGTLDRDRERYPSSQTISGWFLAAGFENVATDLAQRMLRTVNAREYLERGAAAKHVTSGLALLGDDEYAAGLDRVWKDIDRAESRGEALLLHGDLRIYATSGQVSK